MSQNNVLRQMLPQLSVNEIQDAYAKNNFLRLQEYFLANNQLLGFQFFEFNFTQAQSNFRPPHGLKYIPQDIIITKLVGTGEIHFNRNLFSDTYMDITVTGPCTVRFFVGSYWKSQNVSFGDDDVSQFSAFLASSQNVVNSSSTLFDSVLDFYNVGLSSYLNGTGLTFKMTDKDGQDLSETSYAKIGFRGAVATLASYLNATVTESPTITLPASATLGMGSGAPYYIFVYALYSPDSKVYLGLSLKRFNDGSLVSTTGISSASTSGTTMYSNAAFSSVPCRLIGRVKVEEASAGTHNTAPTEVATLTQHATVDSGNSYPLAIDFAHVTGGSATIGFGSGAIASISRTSAGLYTITFTSNYYQAAPAMAFYVENTAAAKWIYSISAITANDMAVRFSNVADTVNVDANFCVILCGYRKF